MDATADAEAALSAVEKTIDAFFTPPEDLPLVTDEPDPETIAKGVNRTGKNRKFSPKIIHIGAQALRVQFPEIAKQVFSAVIEVMVAEGDIIIAPCIHSPGDREINAL